MPVRPLLLHRMALVSFRLYVSEKFGQLARIFWANGLPPPWQKISRTPMCRVEIGSILVDQKIVFPVFLKLKLK